MPKEADSPTMVTTLFSEASRLGVTVRVADTCRNQYHPGPMRIDVYRWGRTDENVLVGSYPVEGVSAIDRANECCILAHELGHHLHRLENIGTERYDVRVREAYRWLNFDPRQLTAKERWYIIHEETIAWVIAWRLLKKLGPAELKLRTFFVLRASKSLLGYLIGMLGRW